MRGISLHDDDNNEADEFDLGNKSLPRPDWEPTMQLILPIGIMFIIFITILTAYLEAMIYLSSQQKTPKRSRIGRNSSTASLAQTLLSGKLTRSETVEARVIKNPNPKRKLLKDCVQKVKRDRRDTNKLFTNDRTNEQQKTTTTTTTPMTTQQQQQQQSKSEGIVTRGKKRVDNYNTMVNSSRDALESSGHPTKTRKARSQSADQTISEILHKEDHEKAASIDGGAMVDQCLRVGEEPLIKHEKIHARSDTPKKHAQDDPMSDDSIIAATQLVSGLTDHCERLEVEDESSDIEPELEIEDHADELSDEEAAEDEEEAEFEEQKLPNKTRRDPQADRDSHNINEEDSNVDAHGEEPDSEPELDMADDDVEDDANHNDQNSYSGYGEYSLLGPGATFELPCLRVRSAQI